jgi:hypothetical protein
MNRTILAFLAVAAMAASLGAHAQLTSVDHGAAAIDGNGLMWANTVGTNLSWSPTGAAGSAQAWVGGLNASDYGGYNNWTLATGNGSVAANRTTNQLGELFYSDCGNSPGTSSVLNNAGKNCTALSAVNNVINSNTNGVTNGGIFFSSSLYGTNCCDPINTYWWAYLTPNSNQQPWNADTQFGFIVGLGDAVAVRAAPEIDPASAASGLTLLLGALAVLRGRRTSTAKALAR